MALNETRVVIIEHRTTPNGYGIVQVNREKMSGTYSILCVSSPCCGALVEFEWNEVHDWNCGGCHKEVKDPMSPFNAEYIETDASEQELKNWVAGWTGVEAEDVHVTVQL